MLNSTLFIMKKSLLAILACVFFTSIGFSQSNFTPGILTPTNSCGAVATASYSYIYTSPILFSFTYTSSNNGTITNNVMNNEFDISGAGTYTIYVNSGNGIIDTLYALVNPIPYVSASDSIINGICNASLASASVWATSGIAPISYAWSNGATTSTA
jgi:hypothetical protein